MEPVPLTLDLPERIHPRHSSPNSPPSGGHLQGHRLARNHRNGVRGCTASNLEPSSRPASRPSNRNNTPVPRILWPPVLLRKTSRSTGFLPENTQRLPSPTLRLRPIRHYTTLHSTGHTGQSCPGQQPVPLRSHLSTRRSIFDPRPSLGPRRLGPPLPQPEESNSHSSRSVDVKMASISRKPGRFRLVRSSLGRKPRQSHLPIEHTTALPTALLHPRPHPLLPQARA